MRETNERNKNQRDKGRQTLPVISFPHNWMILTLPFLVASLKSKVNYIQLISMSAELTFSRLQFFIVVFYYELLSRYTYRRAFHFLLNENLLILERVCTYWPDFIQHWPRRKEIAFRSESQANTASLFILRSHALTMTIMKTLLLLVLKTALLEGVFNNCQSNRDLESHRIQGAVLVGYAFVLAPVFSSYECADLCLRNARCKSFNFINAEQHRTCQLNTVTADDKPGELLARKGTDFYNIGCDSLRKVSEPILIQLMFGKVMYRTLCYKI